MMQLISIYPPLRAVNFEPIFKHRRHYECTRPAVATPLSGHGILTCAKVSICNLLGCIADFLCEGIVWHFSSSFFLKQWADYLLVGRRRYQNPRGRLTTSTDELTKVDGTGPVKEKATRFAPHIYWWNTPSQEGRRLGSKTR